MHARKAMEVSEIEPGLFLCGVDEASCVDTLRKHRITHILTIDCCSLNPRIDAIIYKFVKINDHPDEPLILHFDQCYNFLQNALSQDGGKIMVHCQMGISRSVTVVAAYLMKHHRWSANSAMAHIQATRPRSDPNPGFVYQLGLYEQLGYMVDEHSPILRKFFISKAARLRKYLDKTAFSQEARFADDPEYKPVAGALFRCKKCRRPLFRSDSIVVHAKGANEELYYANTEKPMDPCTEGIYILPVQWMCDMILTASGKITCPKCISKLGSFDWSGRRCTCRAWLTPTFHVVPSKVDQCVLFGAQSAERSHPEASSSL